MGQDWQLINLDTNQTTGFLGKLGESLWEDHSDLVELLCLPPFPAKPARKADAGPRSRSGSPRRSPAGSASFADLLAAPEIVTLIFEHLQEYSDILRFGLTNSEVWDCGERAIKLAYTKYRAPFAGARLICLGDYVQDIPEHLNNAVDLCDFATAVTYTFRDCHVWFDGQNPNGPSTQKEGEDNKSPNVLFQDLVTDEAKERWETRLGKLMQGIYNNATPTPMARHPDYALLKTVKSISGAAKWADLEYISRYRSPFRLKAADVPKHSKPEESEDEDEDEIESVLLQKKAAEITTREIVMVLRNLTKHQYVRSDTFAVTGEDRVWGFGRAIMSRVCWSTDPSCAMRWKGDIHRGVWAGDAFDVVPLSEFREVTSPTKGWTDVTAEVRKELEDIWKSEYGAHWIDEAW